MVVDRAMSFGDILAFCTSTSTYSICTGKGKVTICEPKWKALVGCLEKTCLKEQEDSCQEKGMCTRMANHQFPSYYVKMFDVQKVAVSPSNSMTVTKLQARLVGQIIITMILLLMTACLTGSHVLIVLQLQRRRK